MHIKNIVINGFKSYRDQSFEGYEFHTGHNVIVGLNGSGKSNFFSAIQFVLSEKYSKLRTEERQALLHEGSGRGVMSAFVEILFDNSDSRLPIDKHEVAIRRTIGLKKDEYRIDGKTVPQREVMNLLESAGFSSSNPYYIVEQGKVSLLTTMKDADRLELLKDVAGTRVYDEKKRESLKIMSDTEQRKTRIDEVIQYVEERLAELEKEKKELKAFQKHDKQRRSVEYVLYDKELKDAIQKLEDLEASRQEAHERSNTLHLSKLTAQENLQNMEREIKRYKSQISELKKERDLLEVERQDKIRQRTKQELELKDTERQRTTDDQTVEKSKEELQKLQDLIQKKRSDLEDINPRYDRLKSEVATLQERISDHEVRMAELYSKQGRKEQFRSARERDQWLNEEIDNRRNMLQQEQQQRDEMEREVQKLRSDIEELSKKIDEKKESIATKRRTLEQNVRFSERRRSERDGLHNQRKELWREQRDCEMNIQKSKEEMTNAERRLDSQRPRTVNKGLSEARRIIREHGITGVHGTVIELMRVNDKYHRAVEVTVGNSLFHLVVESDRVAADILKIMNREKVEGRVTFMPLNRLQPQVLEVEGRSTDFVPLWKKIEYDARFEKIFQQLFGKTYVCRDLRDGALFAREHNVNCVTLNGDQAERKGSMTGGYFDTAKSKIAAHDKLQQSKHTLQEEEDNLTKIARRITALDTQVNTKSEELHKLESEMHNLRTLVSQETQDLQLMVTRESTLKELQKQREQLLDAVKVGIRRNEETINSLQSEIGTALHATLTRNEQNELTQLANELEDVKKQFVEKNREKMDVETSKNELENTLNYNLVIRSNELQQQIQQLEIREERQVSTETMDEDLERLRREIDDIISKQEDIDEQMDGLNEKLKTATDRLEEMRSEESQSIRNLEERANALEKLLNRRKIWTQKKEEYLRRIRELGTIPSDYMRYEDLTIRELMNKLHETNEQLKKYGHINKKALDQYEQFKQQKEDFMAKKKELDRGAQAIKDLIKTLDQRKDEAIARTFKQVSMNFSQIFNELVPGGRATMIMKMNGPATEREEEDMELEEEEEEEEAETGEQETRTESSVRQYSGIAIQVLFPGAGEANILQQLSGGQKTLVALTLIFAIQRCDPAPFYLFDEIDSALDAAYRTSVARMIHDQSRSTDGEPGIQFITTTFKTEMVEHADQYYGIQYRNKVSRISNITKEQALSILAEEEELQRHRVTGDPTPVTDIRRGIMERQQMREEEQLQLREMEDDDSDDVDE